MFELISLFVIILAMYLAIFPERIARYSRQAEEVGGHYWGLYPDTDHQLPEELPTVTLPKLTVPRRPLA